MKKVIVFVVVILGLATSLKAQQEAMFTHYMFNTIGVNPAYAGSQEALCATLLHRSQWIDFKGAPTTQTFTLHSPLKNRKLGLGLSLLNDRAGVVKNMAAAIDFSYRIRLSEKSKLAFGIKAGINSVQANLNTLLLEDQNDVTFQNNINSKVLPNFGFGLYYSRERFYAGIGSPRLLENNFKLNQSRYSTEIDEGVRHFYFIAGALFKLSETIDLKPTTFIKGTAGAPMQADITTTFIVRKKLSFGAMFRTGDAFGALLGYRIGNYFQIGYSYDWSFGLKNFVYNTGTHEIMLRFDIPSKGSESKVSFF